MSMALPHPLASAAQARPKHPLLVVGEQRWSAEELAVASAQLAAWWAEQGVQPGDLVALHGPADTRWVLALHGLGWLGACVAPLARREDVVALQSAWEEGLEIAPGRRLWRLCADADADANVDANTCVAGLSWPTDRQDVAPRPERFWPLDEVRLLVATSGTTGAPRWIPITVAQMVFSAFGSALRLGHALDDAWLVCLPLHRVGGLSALMRCAWYGTTAVLAVPFAAEAVHKQVRAGRVSLLSLVPVMLERLLDAADASHTGPDGLFAGSRLRAVLLGGASASPQLLARAAAAGLPVVPTWGMTEAASQVATCFPSDVVQAWDETGSQQALAALGCGPPLGFARVTGGSVQEPQALSVLGPLVGNAAGTLTTGDRGYVDEAGRVQVSGRMDDVIISGGVNLDPVAIEAVVTQHPQVLEAAVFGVPDEQWGARPAVAVVLQDRACVEVIREWCLQRFAPERYRCPDHWCVVKALPRGETVEGAAGGLGKVQRRRLRHAWDAGRLQAGLNAAERELWGVDGQQTQALQPGAQVGGESGGLERGSVNKRVDQFGDGHLASLSVVVTNRISKSDRAGAVLRDGQINVQDVAHAGRAFEVGFAVHDGHDPVVVSDEVGGSVGEALGQHGFEGHVAEFKKTSKEGDTGTVGFEKADGKGVFESHVGTPLQAGGGPVSDASSSSS